MSYFGLKGEGILLNLLGRGEKRRLWAMVENLMCVNYRTKAVRAV